MSVAEAKASTIVEYHKGDEAYDAGWYIIYLDADGTSYDASGPYDTEAEAIRLTENSEVA